jgi:hypothetical protein
VCSCCGCLSEVLQRQSRMRDTWSSGLPKAVIRPVDGEYRGRSKSATAKAIIEQVLCVIPSYRYFLARNLGQEL